MLAMKFALALTLGFIGTVTTKPIPWSNASPRSAFARQAEANSILASRSISSDPTSFAASSYDYIIVGGGTAGLTLAARLSQSGQYTVGVLEAGSSGLGVPIIDIPGDLGADLRTEYDCKYSVHYFDYSINSWSDTGNYTTVAGSGNNSGVPAVYWPRGKVYT